jgi:hypothetical protein
MDDPTIRRKQSDLKQCKKHMIANDKREAELISQGLKWTQTSDKPNTWELK